MKCIAFVTLLLLLATAPLAAQEKAAKTPNYFQPSQLHVELILARPPAPGSERDREEMNELLQIQAKRTDEQIKAAQQDDLEEDIFIFRNVVGPDFTAEKLPAMALLSKRLKNDSEMVDPPLKHLYLRPRPYVASAKLHSVCKPSSEPSYPSGHAMLGYLFAYALAQIIPAKHEAILQRADEYAHNRLVCGVHYRSDTEASRFASAVLFGVMLDNSQFLHDLDAARSESGRVTP